MRPEFERWAREASRPLLRVAYLLTGSQPDAEDLAQDTLLLVSRAWHRVHTSPDAYAHKVMYRRAVSIWRRPRLRLTHQNADRAEPSVDSDLRLTLKQVLARLPPRQRAVLVLRYYGDLSESQTAELLGCSVGTVKSQTHKALTALRRTAPELASFANEERTHA